MLRTPLSLASWPCSPPRLVLAVVVLLVVLLAAVGTVFSASSRSADPQRGEGKDVDLATGGTTPARSELQVVAPPVLGHAPAPAPSPVAAPSPAARHVRETATVPILMYHHVNDLAPSVRDSYLRELTVSSTHFRQQLEFLAAKGARTVSLADLMEYLNGGAALPDRAVILTFDDGYDDNYRIAYPLLRQHAMTGTFFVVANLVGKPGYMTWDQLREMQANGMAIESHSLDHVDLRKQPPAELRRQLSESRRILEQQLGRPVRFLNYPAGQYTPEVVAAARAAGYEAAVTVNYHLVQRRDAPFELNRVRVSGADTVESLAAKMVPTFWKYPRGRFGQ